MRAGEFPDGSRVLRAKIDMQHENMQLRDPVMYRIRHAHHHRTGDVWCIYPTYDWAHGQSDAIEGVTHSLCTLEFDSHRPLYDWFLEQLPLPGDRRSRREFARLELTHTVTSKRKLRKLVDEGRRRLGRPAHAHAARPAPPRLPAPAIARLLRRSSASPAPTPATRSSCWKASCARPERDRAAPHGGAAPAQAGADQLAHGRGRDPVVEHFEVANNPENPDDGTREVAFTGELWIEADDFAEVPPPKFFRLSPGARSGCAAPTS
jgi:glutaminyl-tRNA synthetase